MREQAVDVLKPAGAERPALGVSVSWTLAGYGAYMACQWAMLIVTARLGSPEKVGELALGLAVSAPVVLFTNLGLRKIQVTDVAGQFSFADYFGLRLVMNLVALGAMAAIVAVAGYDAAGSAAILAVGLAKTVEATSDVIYGALQRGERMDLVAGSLFLRGITCVAGLGTGMALTRNVALGMMGVALGWLGVLLFYDLPQARKVLHARGGSLAPRWSPRVLSKLVWLALPLGIVVPVMALMASVPAVIIEKLKGAGELGLYTALAYSYAASNRIASAMGEAACARLAQYYAEGRRAAFSGILRRLLALAALGGTAGLAAALAIGRPVLSFLYGTAYAERADLLAGFMGVSIAGNLACVLDYSMTAMRRLRIQPILASSSVLVYGGLSFILIRTWGLAGAVMALGSVSLIQGAATLAVVARAWSQFPTPCEAPRTEGV